MRAVGMTHVGKVRSINEDTLLIECEKNPQYMLVADGMGGHAAGEVASMLAAKSIKRFIRALKTKTLCEAQIINAIRFANEKIRIKTQENESYKGMGTTLTFAYAAEDNKLILAQIGDSSAYLFNGEKVKKLTKDHTYVQHLIDSGVIKKNNENEYPFKNIITRAMGMEKLEIDIYHTEWKEGDSLLLCSDGLTEYVNRKMFKEVLSTHEDIRNKAKTLVNHALVSGGKDNITLIIAANSKAEDTADD